MPDHLHWLIILGTETLDTVIRRINPARTGHTRALWQKGYHDHAIRKEDGIRATARYIIANPLRAGLAELIGDYLLWDAVWL